MNNIFTFGTLVPDLERAGRRAVSTSPAPLSLLQRLPNLVGKLAGHGAHTVGHALGLRVRAPWGHDIVQLQDLFDLNRGVRRTERLGYPRTHACRAYKD